MLSRDFREFIESLNANSVRYLVVGGYAVALHGYPRYTKDLDVWIEPTAQNAQNVLNALTAFGFGSLDISTGDFLEENTIIQLGYPPNRIDLMTTLSGLTFEVCYPERVQVEIQGVLIDFIDLENLKTNKKETGRPQDLADFENLSLP
ncbi:MAG: nucleotidyltransferase [Desulfobacterales bacterium]